METDSTSPQPASFAERETIQRALRGDTGAFEEVIALYSRRLYAVAYGVVQDVNEAEDVVQDTFLKAYAHRWLIRDPEKFPAWLCRTARNRACDLLRKRSKDFLLEEDQRLETITDNRVPRPGANLDAAEKTEAVHRLLDTLPENYRVAVTLRFMEGMGHREIEETMGISNGSLRGILVRAMRTLRERIGTPILPDLTGIN